MSSEADGEWRLVTPAPKSAGLELAGPIARVRRLVLKQIRDDESVALFHGDKALCVAMFGRHGWRRVEIGLAISRGAHVHMRRIVRLAQLTLRPIAETKLIVASIHPANKAGQRLAVLIGFERARLKSRSLWVFRSERHGCNPGRRIGRGAQAGGAVAPDAGGGE